MDPNGQKFIEQRTLKTPKSAGVTLCPLPPTAVLRIRGEDAPAFLQGQITCDVRQITPTCAGLGAICTPQGRVIATFWLLRDDLGFCMLLAADLAEKIAHRLRLYILRSKVTIAAEKPALFGVSAAAPDRLRRALGDLPQARGAVVHAHRLYWLRMLPPGERWLVLGEAEAAQALWLELAETLGAAESPATYWQLADIRAGLPRVTAATSEAFLPQMLNLDRLGGISFDKGCYTGQEIIARAHYLGQIKRRLYRVRLEGPHTPDPGAPLLVQGESVGQVVNAAPADSGQEMLAVVRCDQAHNPAIRLAGHSDAPLQWLDLTYT
ncbi:folate-binding protein YgfZ [Methylothermus subterraneus]